MSITVNRGSLSSREPCIGEVQRRQLVVQTIVGSDTTILASRQSRKPIGCLSPPHSTISSLSIGSKKNKTPKQVSFLDQVQITGALVVPSLDFGQRREQTVISRATEGEEEEKDKALTSDPSQQSKNLAGIKNSIKSRLMELERRIQLTTVNSDERVAALEHHSFTGSAISNDVNHNKHCLLLAKPTSIKQDSQQFTAKAQQSVYQIQRQLLTSEEAVQCKIETVKPILEEAIQAPNNRLEGNQISEVRPLAELKSVERSKVSLIIPSQQVTVDQTTSNSPLLAVADNLSKYKIDPRRQLGEKTTESVVATLERSASSQQLKKQLDNELDISLQKHVELQQIKNSINQGLHQVRKSIILEPNQPTISVEEATKSLQQQQQQQYKQQHQQQQQQQQQPPSRLYVKMIKDYSVQSSIASKQSSSSSIELLKKEIAEEVAARELQRRIDACIIQFQQERSNSSHISSEQQNEIASSARFKFWSPLSGKQRYLEEATQSSATSPFSQSEAAVAQSSQSFVFSSPLKEPTDSSSQKLNNSRVESRAQHDHVIDANAKYKEIVKKLITDKVADWMEQSMRVDHKHASRKAVKPLILASSYRKVTSPKHLHRVSLSSV